MSLSSAASSPPLVPATPRVGPLLLVDDDPLIAGAARRALRREGIEALVFEDAEAARAAFTARAGRVCAVVIDLRLGDTWGPSLVAAWREHQPGLPVLLTSGDPAGHAACDEVGWPVDFLAKPFRGRALIEKVQALVAAAPVRTTARPA